MDKNDLRMGRTVKALREFSGVPVGTKGEIVEASNSWPETESVAIAWRDRCGCGGLCDSKEPCPMAKPPLTDWFSFDDLQYLEAE